MKNKYIIKDNICTLFIKDRGKLEKVLIDMEDFDKINSYARTLEATRPRKNSAPYCIIRNGKRHIRLHRFIVTAKKDEIIDHINRNTLDNRKCNLRIVSRKLNSMNRVKANRNNRSTGFLNVQKVWNGYYVIFRKQVGKNETRMFYSKHFKRLKDAKEHAILKRKELFRRNFNENLIL